MEGWLACLTKLGIPEDNPALAKATSVPELPEPPTPYSPMILPDPRNPELLVGPNSNFRRSPIGIAQSPSKPETFGLRQAGRLFLHF